MDALAFYKLLSDARANMHRKRHEEAEDTLLEMMDSVWEDMTEGQRAEANEYVKETHGDVWP